MIDDDLDDLLIDAILLSDRRHLEAAKNIYRRLFRWRHKLILEISIEYNRLHHILSGKKRDETRAGTLLRQT